MNSTTESNPKPATSSGQTLMALGAYLLVSASVLGDRIACDQDLFAENELFNFWLTFDLTIGVVLIGLFCGVTLTPIWCLCCWRKWHRGFVVFCGVIALLFVGNAVFIRLRSPPSASRYFNWVFGAKLPKSAHEIRVQGRNLADPNVMYYFSCDSSDTNALAKELGMIEVMPSPGYSRDDFGYIPSPPWWPDYTSWKERRLFERRNGKTGRIDTLLCDEQGMKVYVYKDPGGSKTDEELGEAAADVAAPK